MASHRYVTLSWIFFFECMNNIMHEGRYRKSVFTGKVVKKSLSVDSTFHLFGAF